MNAATAKASVTHVEDRRLIKVTGAIDDWLAGATGLRSKDRKTIVYYTIATHDLPNLDTFPLLALVGQMGTGKSQGLRIVKSFARLPIPLSLRGMTLPAIRDEFAKCDCSTAIVEEADYAWHDHEAAFERLLSDRYQRASATAAHKEAQANRQWKQVTQSYFGATVLHRRIPFSDAALDGRTVTVHFRADHSRTYQEFTEGDPLVCEVAQLLTEIPIKLCKPDRPPGVAARIFNTYAPVLAAAQLSGDFQYCTDIQETLLLETAELKEAQSSESDGLVLRAIIDHVSKNGNFVNVRVSALSKSIFDSHRVSLMPRQVGAIARQLEFIVKNSHGQSVVAPTPASLLKAAMECSYEDEFIADLRRKVLGNTAAVDGVDEV